jgi:hypothetical protein
VITAWTLKHLSVVGVLNLDIINGVRNLVNVLAIKVIGQWVLSDRLIDSILVSNRDSVTTRMNSRHVMKEGTLLYKALVAMSTGVSVLFAVAHDVVIHRVLACAGLIAALVAANEVPVGVLSILNWHSCTGKLL